MGKGKNREEMLQSSTGPPDISTFRGLADDFRETESCLGVSTEKDTKMTEELTNLIQEPKQSERDNGIKWNRK